MFNPSSRTRRSHFTNCDFCKMDSPLSRCRCHQIFTEFHFSTTRFTIGCVHSVTSRSPRSVHWLDFGTNKFHSLLSIWIRQLPSSGHFQEISTCNAGATCNEKEVVVQFRQLTVIKAKLIIRVFPGRSFSQVILLEKLYYFLT